MMTTGTIELPAATDLAPPPDCVTDGSDFGDLLALLDAVALIVPVVPATGSKPDGEETDDVLERTSAVIMQPEVGSDAEPDPASEPGDTGVSFALTEPAGSDEAGSALSTPKPVVRAVLPAVDAVAFGPPPDLHPDGVVMVNVQVDIGAAVDIRVSESGDGTAVALSVDDPAIGQSLRDRLPSLAEQFAVRGLMLAAVGLDIRMRPAGDGCTPARLRGAPPGWSLSRKAGRNQDLFVGFA